jgi:hypothetical protein
MRCNRSIRSYQGVLVKHHYVFASASKDRVYSTSLAHPRVPSNSHPFAVRDGRPNSSLASAKAEVQRDRRFMMPHGQRLAGAQLHEAEDPLHTTKLASCAAGQRQ